MRRAEYSLHTGQGGQGEGLMDERAWRTLPCGRAATWDQGWLKKVEASGLYDPGSRSFTFFFLSGSLMVIQLAATSPSCKAQAGQEPLSPTPEEEKGS